MRQNAILAVHKACDDVTSGPHHLAQFTHGCLQLRVLWGVACGNFST